MDETFYIVETEDDIFLGLLEFTVGAVIIHNGFRGRPNRVDADDIVQLYPAHMHPAVEPDNEKAQEYALSRFILAL